LFYFFIYYDNRTTLTTVHKVDSPAVSDDLN